MEYAVEDLRRVSLKIASEAAGLLRDMSCTSSATRKVGKETFRADIESESYILDALRSEGIKGKILTEESGVIETGNDLVVLVDPLDGSRNYANCIPWSSVSIAIAPGNAIDIREVIAGAVAPVFYGEPISFANNACYLGGSRIEPPTESENFVYVYVEHPEAARLLSDIIMILGGGFKVRSLGSAALEVAYVGIGRGKAFIDLRPKLRNIDIAAGLGIIKAMGGTYLGKRGETPRIGLRTIERVDTIAVFARDVPLEVIREISQGPLSSAGQRP